MPSSAENVARADLALAIAFSFASGTFVACGFARGFLERNGELAALMQAYRRARYLARPKCERDGCELRPSKYHLCFQHRRCEHPGGCGRLAAAADRLCDKHGGRRRRRRRRKTCATADCRRLATSGDGLCNPCGGGEEEEEGVRDRRLSPPRDEWRRALRPVRGEGRKTCAAANCGRLATRSDGLCNPCGGRARRARPPVAACDEAAGSATRDGGRGGRRRRPPIVAASRRVATARCSPGKARCRRCARRQFRRRRRTRSDGLCNPCDTRRRRAR